ncbi:hypothetical protein NNJEOMEG_02226 [Fundidesulfovibrio magnetotacticus]|uniref:Acyltransferase n=1 Tax=Fundidesulfovibrio magnetotacticus TaxID=2730080 RepID=A0A6V8LP90_9BACT|nr:hypothetical protein [Fundidesulfovibrio magnetotacticus]GFK94382.1 hypothetical protein NNJEOMEG_02226 [Fundidesulfovibrio magnetotacticus]
MSREPESIKSAAVPGNTDAEAVLCGAAAAVVLASAAWDALTGGELAASRYGTAALAMLLLAYGHASALMLEHAAGQDGLRRFYLAWAVRVFPLHALALAAWAVLEGRMPDGWAWAGLRSPFWIVEALVPCVALAPAFQALRRRFGQEGFAGGLLMGTALVNAVAWQLPETWRTVAFSDLFAFRGVVLGQLAVFAAGMLLPELARRMASTGATARGITPARRVQALAAYVVILFLLGERKGGFSDVLGAAGIFLFSMAFAAALLAGRAGFPAPRALAALGRGALALCLFVPLAFQALPALGVVPGSSQSALAAAVALLVCLSLCLPAGRGLERLARATGMPGNVPG